MKLTRWFLPIVIALLGILTLTMPIAASEPQPTVLEIQGIAAYENAKETGDQLYIITYEITGNYTQNIDQLFIFRLVEDDAEKDATEAFPFHDQGFGLGIVAFYFASADAPVWEGNVSVQIIGNPLVDWDGAVPSIESDIIEWNTGTTAEVQAELTAKILYLANELGQSWDVELVTTVQGVMSLTSAGAAYFLTVVPYCGEMIPYVFGSYTFSPDYPIDEKPPADDYASWLDTAVEDTIFDIGPVARAHGWSASTIRAGFYYGFVIFLFVLLLMKGRLNKGTMLLFWPFVVAGAFFGVPLQVTIIAGFFMLISTVWVFYKGTT